MRPRGTARWQKALDERILELLDDEPWSTPSLMAIKPHIYATENQIKDRCKVLADAELISIDLDDGWRLELRGLGKRYLEGEVDVDLYPNPRPIRQIDEEVFGSRS